MNGGEYWAYALGNTLAVTEKHYNPWSKVRQSQLDGSVRAGWADDPLLLQLEAQGKRAVIN